jgi:diguanylate cyclase (GGDEF)-like protein
LPRSHGTVIEEAAILGQIRREADLDLLTRLASGAVAYFVFLLLLGTTTVYEHEFPRLFWWCAAAIFVASGMRFALAALFRWRGSLHHRIVIGLTAISVFLSAGASGVLHASALWRYGYSNWTFTVTMLWVVGIASGSTISFTPNFRLLLLHITLLFGPVIACSMVAITRESISFAAATVVLCAFLIVQGYRLHGMYWNLLQNRALDARRTAELQAAKAAAEVAHEVLRFQATHDGLTGLYNRSEALSFLEREISRSARKREPVSVLMLDIDHFKQINDTYGHFTGDDVLRSVARTLKDAVRAYDLAARYGGEEFLIIMSGCNQEETQTFAERVRASIADTPIAAAAKDLRVTVSIGAVSADAVPSQRELLLSADEALYKAKRAGRNRVVTWSKGSTQMTTEGVSAFAAD